MVNLSYQIGQFSVIYLFVLDAYCIHSVRECRLYKAESLGRDQNMEQGDKQSDTQNG